jgi:lysophospholipase L1-like esterase
LRIVEMINKLILLRHLKALTIFNGLLAFIFVFTLTAPVYAALPITQKDIDSINKREYYRDPDEPVAEASCGATTVGTVNKIYMIGDSITEGSERELIASLSATGASPVVDGLSSRSLSTGEDPKDGLSVLSSSANAYKDADVIVIALGTNGGLTESGIIEAINIVREANTNATIFWVNIGVDNSLRTGNNLPAKSWNTVLSSTAEKLKLSATDKQGYFIIDWARVIESQSEDFNINIIADDGLGVHPNADGKKLFAQTVVNGVFSEGSRGGCSLELVGSDNPEKVWNYMIAKGLTPFQAAGFMGNMQAEAGFEPRRLEYAFSDPPHLSDNVPPCGNDKCQPGYGIVQWTAENRKNGLRLISEEQSKIAGDLGLQLDYVWQEISSGGTFRGTTSVRNAYIDKYGGNVPVLDALKQTKTVEEATDLILNHYEIPAGIDAAYIKRVGFARTWLVRFGSGGSQ